MNASLTDIREIIPQSRIVVFSPHFDDVLFMLGGYIDGLKKADILDTKQFHIQIIFSKSNYLCRSGKENFNGSLDRIKLATGKRLLEDQECTDEMLGKFNYRYELLGEMECFTRGKRPADSQMEFPFGMYPEFDENDWKIFRRMKERIRACAEQNDTAMIFPTAFKEHIDHFIVREAAMEVATEMGSAASATFYFQEDKPYGGIASTEELGRVSEFVNRHRLHPKAYRYDPERMIELAFRHYVSQVEEVYKTGIRNRALFLKEELKADLPVDRIYQFDPRALGL